jgi:choline dehydrogenase-like flavoprotein
VLVWVFVVIVALVVFAIAAAVVGREAGRLGTAPPRAVVDMDAAVDYVADAVAFEVSASLSHDDVRALLRLHLLYFDEKGVPTDVDAAVAGAPVVVADEEARRWVLDRARAEGLEATADEVDAVLAAHLEYLVAIGAVGTPVEGPDEPTDSGDGGHT